MLPTRPETCTSASDVAKYILRKCIATRGEKITGLKLQKLLFYSQAYYLAAYDQPLFADRIEAWSHGPVVPSVNIEYKEFGLEAIDREVADPHLHSSVSEHLDDVLKAYGDFSGPSLQQMTHRETPWLKARGNTPSGGHGSAEIDTASMADFYRTQLILDDGSGSGILQC